MPNDTQTEPAPAAPPDSGQSTGESSGLSPEVLEIESMFGEGPSPSPSPNTVGQLRPSSQNGLSQRQYADEEEKRYFRDMSNEAYNKLYPIWSQHKNGEFVPKSEHEKRLKEAEERASQVKSERWYDHPKAYLLSEDYGQAQHNAAIYRDIVDHYRTALANVTNGRGFYRIVPDANEKFIIDTRQEIPASPQAHAFITAELSRFYHEQMNADQQLKQFETGFGQRFNPIKQALDKVESTTFERYEKAPGFERAWKGELSMFPRELQGLPEYRLLAKASVILKALELKRGNNKQLAAQNATRPDTSQGGGAVSDAAAALAKLNEMTDRH